MSRLLVCDLDGTLLGDARSLAVLLELLRKPGAPVLAFASGRQGFSAIEALRKWGVKDGSYLIAGVGSELYRRVGARWIQLASWPRLNARWDVNHVRRELEAIPDLAEQPLSSRSPYKLSYFAPRAALSTVNDRLQSAAIHATVVHSHGDLLDVLPGGVDKGSAVTWLSKLLSIGFERTMTCGNTENDLAMLRLPCPGIIVGEADPELVEASTSLPNVFLASEACAAGILEGLRFFGWSNGIDWAA